MIPTTDPSKRTQSERIAADVAAFQAGGGQIKRLGPGEFGFDALTNKQRINPTVVDKERRAKALQEGKRSPAPKPPRPRRPVKVAAPRPPRPPKAAAAGARVRTAEMRRAAKGKPMGKPPHKANEIIALLQAKGPLRCRAIAEILGDNINTVGQRLWVMRERGQIASEGNRGNMRWKVK